MVAHDLEKHVLDLIGDGYRFSDRVMRKDYARAGGVRPIV
jgi:hypothetical protein